MGIKKDKSRLAAENLRSEAELRLDAKGEELHQTRTEIDLLRLVHELEVHRIQLEMQNAALSQSRDEQEKLLEKYTDLYDFSSVGYFTLDRKGVICSANLTLCSLLKIERARLIGKAFAKFVADEYHQHFNDFLKHIFTGQGQATCELTLNVKGNSPINLQIVAIASESQQECRVAVIDISRSKQAEEALLISEKIYRAIGESIDYGIWICAPDGRNIYASESFLRLVGLTQEQFSDFGWGYVLHPDDAEHTISAWKECVRTEAHWDREHRFRGVDGQWHHILARGLPVRNERGEIIYWSGINLDISRKMKIEDDLRKSEHHLAIAQSIAHLGSWEWDQITCEVTGSDEFYRIFGLHFNSYQEFLKLVHPDDREVVNEKVQETLDRHSPYNIFYRIVPPDGTIRIIHAIGKIITDDAGNIVQMIGTAQNITERRHTEESLAEKRQELSEMNRSLEIRISTAVDELRQKDQLLILQERQALMGDMINNIAHQWRQPLNSLGLVIQQLPIFYDSGDLSGELLKKKTVKAMELIQHMSKTIEDFSNFFRADKEMVIFGVGKVIALTLSLIEQGYLDQQIRITTHMEGDPMVRGYPNEFAQVLLNILLNARDELINNNVDAALISLSVFAERGKTVVTITDNAGGIAEEIMDRIFDPYFSTKGPDKGSGLGLFMSKTIIEKNMGGALSARNTGSGAEFRIEVDSGHN